MRELVDRGAERLLSADGASNGISQSPVTRIGLLLTLADVYRAMSQPERAMSLANRAKAESEALGEPLLVAESQAAVGRAHYLRGDYAEAVRRLEQAVALYDVAPDSDRQAAGRASSDLGAARIATGDGEAAERALRRSLGLLDAGVARGVARQRLGALMNQRGDLAAARARRRSSSPCSPPRSGCTGRSTPSWPRSSTASRWFARPRVRSRRRNTCSGGHWL